MSQKSRDNRPDPSQTPSADNAGLSDGMIAGFDLIPSKVVVTDPSGTIQYVNPHGLKLCGYQASEMVGRPLATFWEQPHERSQNILSHLARHRFWQGEIKHRDKEGPGHWELVSLSLIFRENLPDPIIVMMGQQLLPEKQTRMVELETRCQQLQEKTESLGQIVESAPYSIIVTRLSDSRYLRVNEAFCRRMGYRREEAVGHTPYELNTFVDPNGRARMLEGFNRDGRVESMEFQFRAKDGTVLESLFSVTPITYNGDACLLAMTVDISELKATQRALKESEERYRNIIMSMEEGYWEVDLKGTYTFVNEAECKIHGRPKKEMIGQRAQSFFYSKTSPEIIDMFHRIYKTGIPAPVYDIEMIKRDGAIAAIESSASLLRDAQGNPVGFFGISRDVSQKRKAEKELERYRQHLEQMVHERTKALEEAQQELIKREKLSTLGRLTATVSHELRNPLAVIRSSNFYLLRKIKDRDEKIDKHLNRIEEQVSHCDHIVSELLEFTRGSKVSMQTEPLQHWLAPLIQQLEETQSITIQSSLPDDLPPLLHDREKMRRVFINLIENSQLAIQDWEAPGKAPPQGYRPKISVAAHRQADQLVVEVTDNGVGMDKETRQKAFDPLYTTRARGTGIGLANVLKIVDQHGGKVSLKSKPGTGTTATITLPCSRDSQ